MAAEEVKKGASLERARAAWGAKAPEWIVELARRCDKTSQSAAAKALDISGAVVNQVLGNAYKGRMDRVELKVRGEFMNATVVCPVVGEISTAACITNQTQKFRPTNPLRVQLRRACPRCPNREDA